MLTKFKAILGAKGWATSSSAMLEILMSGLSKMSLHSTTSSRRALADYTQIATLAATSRSSQDSQTNGLLSSRTQSCTEATFSSRLRESSRLLRSWLLLTGTSLAGIQVTGSGSKLSGPVSLLVLESGTRRG